MNTKGDYLQYYLVCFAICIGLIIPHKIMYIKLPSILINYFYIED